MGSLKQRTYLYVSQSAGRMEIERANARDHGVQDIIDFVFVLDGERIELSYEELKARLFASADNPGRARQDAHHGTNEGDPIP